MTAPGDRDRPRSDGSSRIVPVFIGLPIAVLLLAYVWLAIDHDTPWLWNVVVHENGLYSLRDTIFYFSHVLREVPTIVAMALFLAAAWRSRQAAGMPAQRHRLRTGAAFCLAFTLIAIAWTLEAGRSSPRSALLDLLQYRTRDDVTAWGSHWQFHWLSTIWFAAAAVIDAVLVSDANPPTGARRSNLWTWAWLYFGALTIAFGVSRQAFTDPRFVGHQAREILTHGPVTCLLGLGVLQWMGGRSTAARITLPELIRSVAPSWPWRTALIVFVAVPTYLAFASVTGHALEAGQTQQGLSAMVGAHYFEHMLDYVLVVLLAVGFSAGDQHSARRRSAPGFWGSLRF